MKRIDRTGERFGLLTVLYPGPKRGRKTTWACKCDCGNETTVITDNLVSDHTRSCGCLVKAAGKKKAERTDAKMTGETFGEWTVLERGEKEFYFLCRCSCGVEREVYGSSLIKGVSRSCGHKLDYHIVRKDITGQRYGSLEVVEHDPESGYWWCQCDCGNRVLIRRSNLVSGNSTSCGCTRSKGELEISTLLQLAEEDYETQKTFEWLPKKWRFDFFWKGNLIEFDGDQHKGQIYGYYTEARIRELVIRDMVKNKLCLEKGIPLYRIPYSLLGSIQLEDLTKEEYRVKTIDYYGLRDRFNITDEDLAAE